MKKLLLPFMFMVFWLPLLSQNVQDSISVLDNAFLSKENTELVTNSNVEKLVDKYSAKISASITSLAKELKQPAEHIYKVLVKQQVVCGYTWLGAFLLGLIFFLLGILLVYKFDVEDEFLGGLGIVLIIIFGILMLVGIIGFLASGLSGVLNPEYGAIKDIINMIK